MNAVERKESETPSTPCSSMTPFLEASPIGVSTTASILSQALLNPSSALRGENFLLSVRTMGLDTDTDTDMDMDTARKVKNNNQIISVQHHKSYSLVLQSFCYSGPQQS